MRPATKPWPVVIQRLVEGIVATAQAQGVHGRVVVWERQEGGKLDYVVGVVVPASETVMTRSPSG